MQFLNRTLLMGSRKLLPTFAHIPGLVGLTVWGVSFFYILFGADFDIGFLGSLNFLFPGTARYLSCYSLDENVVSYLLILAWIISFSVTFLVILVIKDSRGFYFSARKKLDVVKFEKFNGNRRVYYWVGIALMYAIVIVPYMRHVFGYEMFSSPCTAYPMSSFLPGRGLIFECVWVIASGEVLGGVIAYFRGKILVNNVVKK